MQRVKPSGNKSTEVKLIQYFKEQHITGWRRGYKVKGHPDFVFSREKNCDICGRLFLARTRLQKYQAKK